MRLISAVLAVVSLTASGTLPALPVQQGEENALRRAAREGRAELVGILLERGIDPNARDEEGDGPLAHAAFPGHIEVVRMLLEHGADVNAVNDNGVTALMLAALGGHAEVVETLVAAGADPNARDRDGDTPLGYYAAAQGHVGVVKVLLELGADVNSEADNGWTPLMAAALAGHTEIVDLLLEHGADVSAQDELGATRLMIAARDGQAAVAEILLERGADPNARDNDGDTPLGFYASLQGHVDVVKLLLEQGADVNAAANDGWTPLMYAALAGHLEVIDLLFEGGADVSAPDQWGTTLLMIASRDGQIGVAEVLLDRGADPNASDNEGRSALMYAAYSGNVDLVRALLERGANVDAVDQTGWTTLMYAALARDPEVVGLLLEHGADVSAPDEVGTTSLMRAAIDDQVDVVRALLEAGADPNARDDGGDTALGYYAVYAGHRDVVGLLLEHGADVNAARNDGFTILMYAAGYGDVEVVRWLLERGAEVDTRSGNANGYEGMTALMLAASEGYTEVLATLLDAGAEVDVVSGRMPNGDAALTALMFAAESGHSESVRLLLRHGADLNAATSWSATPLALAVTMGQTEVVRLLLGQGADVNEADKNGRTVLMDAALGGYAETVEFLLDEGADPNAEDDAGDRALAYAASQGYVEVVTVLLERGADLTAVNHAGATALSLASMNGHPEVVQVLQAAAGATSGTPEVAALSATLPSLSDLPPGAAVTLEGPQETVGLEGYARYFQDADGLAFVVGSSRLMTLVTWVESFADSTLARSSFLATKAMKPEVLADSLRSVFAQQPGFDVDQVVAEEVELPAVGDAAGAWILKMETPMGGFDFLILIFARKQVLGRVMAMGGSGRVALDDLVEIARLIDDRIEDLPQTALGGESTETASPSSGARAALERAELLAEWGGVAEAIAGYSEAQTLDSTLEISAFSWNTLCWYGSLYGHAADVMTACNDAVALDPANGAIRDSRGVARALTGDREGAIEDFEAFVAWTSDSDDRAQRKGWIDALGTGEDPLTPAVLESLVAPSPAAGLDESTRRACMALRATLLTVEDVSGGAVLSDDDFSARPDEEICAHERGFEARSLTFELGSSHTVGLFTVAQLYSGDAAAIQAVLDVKREFLSEDNFFIPPEDIDTIIVETLSVPEIGAVSRAWQARVETTVTDIDVLILVFGRGRVLAGVLAIGFAGKVITEDVTRLAELTDERIARLARPTLAPETVAELITVLTKADSLLGQGDVSEATAAYERARALDSTLATSATHWNSLCWYGSLAGHASDVMAACERAVELAPENGGIRDSRGLARALLGDREGAVEDFEVFVVWTDSDEARERRRSWIEALRAGENPFTAEVLESLRGGW